MTTMPGVNNWSTKRLLIVVSVSVLALLLIAYLLIKVFIGSESGLKNPEAGMPAIKVRVLNGCGYDRLATEYADFISKKNIEVVELGDTPRPIYDKSVIIIRREDEEDLLRLQRMTGIMRYTLVLNENAKTDFDIIIGRDFEDYMKNN